MGVRLPCPLTRPTLLDESYSKCGGCGAGQMELTFGSPALEGGTLQAGRDHLGRQPPAWRMGPQRAWAQTHPHSTLQPPDGQGPLLPGSWCPHLTKEAGPDSAPSWCCQSETLELAGLGEVANITEAADDGQATQADPGGRRSPPSPRRREEPTTQGTGSEAEWGRYLRILANGPGPGIPAPPFLQLLQEGEALGGRGRKGKQRGRPAAASFCLCQTL